MTKVAICIPHMAEFYPAEFVHSLLMLYKPPETTTVILGTKPLDHARNQIVAQALADKAVTHLLWIDSDMSFRHAQDALAKLLAHNKPVVSALYFSKEFPFRPHAYKSDGQGKYDSILDYPEGLFQADAVGMGFCLVQRQVFEKIKHPHFKFDEASGLGEDMYFSKKAREHFPIHVDSALKLFHLRTEAFGEGHFKTARHLIQTGQMPDTLPK